MIGEGRKRCSADRPKATSSVETIEDIMPMGHGRSGNENQESANQLETLLNTIYLYPPTNIYLSAGKALVF
jgi:hypothetical protein